MTFDEMDVINAPSRLASRRVTQVTAFDLQQKTSLIKTTA